MKKSDGVEDIFKQIYKIRKDFKTGIPLTRPQSYYAPHFIATYYIIQYVLEFHVPCAKPCQKFRVYDLTTNNIIWDSAMCGVKRSLP